jgi:hypothetical protein
MAVGSASGRTNFRAWSRRTLSRWVRWGQIPGKSHGTRLGTKLLTAIRKGGFTPLEVATDEGVWIFVGAAAGAR